MMKEGRYEHQVKGGEGRMKGKCNPSPLKSPVFIGIFGTKGEG